MGNRGKVHEMSRELAKAVVRCAQDCRASSPPFVWRPEGEGAHLLLLRRLGPSRSVRDPSLKALPGLSALPSAKNILTKEYPPGRACLP